MPTTIEVNLQTGEIVEREMTAEEISAMPATQPESTASLDNVLQQQQAIILEQKTALEQLTARIETLESK